MATSSDLKSERLEFRTTEDVKAMIQQAAQLQGMSVSDFIASVAYKEATKAVQDHEVIRLNKAETARFVESFLNPPAPNEALRKLMQTQDPRQIH